jgi:hypothetical protein
MWCGQAGRLVGPAGEQEGPVAARTVGNFYELDDRIGRRIKQQTKMWNLLPFAFLSLLTRSLALVKGE